MRCDEARMDSRCAAMNNFFARWSLPRSIPGLPSARTTGAPMPNQAIGQLGDMLVVNLTPGCEYFLTKSNCKFCGYGRSARRRRPWANYQDGFFPRSARSIACVDQSMTFRREQQLLIAELVPFRLHRQESDCRVSRQVRSVPRHLPSG